MMSGAALLVSVVASVAWAGDGEAFYREQVRPLLVEKCLPCHGDRPEKIKGGFDMRIRAGVLAGGDSGESGVVPGDPEASPVYIAVTWQDDLLEMPPKENDRLTPDQVETIRTWIAMGAPWGGEAAGEGQAWDDASVNGAVMVRTSGGLSDDWTYRRYAEEDIWAFRPVPALAPPPGAAHPIDGFLVQGLEAAGIDPAPPADARTLARRLTLGLTGLPPTEADLAAFERAVADNRVGAVEALIDRLLAGRAYGERMAQHWLDVVRYADTAGFANDWERPHAWRYRDYVVRAFNEDKPYDQFVREQIAGDELDPDNPEARIATGFLRMGPWEHTAMSVAAVTRQQFLDDVTNSIGETFLAQPLRCAKCHDHKFDPIPMRDYYRVQAAFASTFFDEPEVPFLSSENLADQETCTEFLETLQSRGPVPITRDEKEDALKRINKKRTEYLNRASRRFAPLAFAVRSGEAEETRILTGGAVESPGKVVEPGVLSVIDLPATIPTDGVGRRGALADWIAHPDNPLTARVMVNRVWQWHFGRGLAGSPNNFGKTGDKPTHPALLDWLAAWFVEQGWSVKALHRLILTSEAYQRSTEHPSPETLASADPDDRLWARFQPRRLSAEEIRDAMLSATGELSPASGGPAVFPFIHPDVALQPRHIMGGIAMAYQASPTPDLRNRRTLYAVRIRTLPDPSLEVFNKPGPDTSCERRDETVVTPQVFALFNSQTAYDRALALAHRASQAVAGLPAQVDLAYRLVLGRSPLPEEAETAVTHVQRMAALHRAAPPVERLPPSSIRREIVAEQSGDIFQWEEQLATDLIEPDFLPWDTDPDTRALSELCLVLLNTGEFLYVY